MEVLMAELESEKRINWMEADTPLAMIENLGTLEVVAPRLVKKTPIPKQKAAEIEAARAKRKAEIEAARAAHAKRKARLKARREANGRPK